MSTSQAKRTPVRRKDDRRLFTWVQSLADPIVLVVTSGWPSADRPGYGVFVRRQVESLARAGFAADVLIVHGYRAKAAYAAAAGELLRSSARSARAYRLVHAHGGEAALAARFYLGAPLLISFLGSDLLGTRGEGRARGVQASLIRANARSAHAVIVKSNAMLNALPATVARRAKVIPTGVDLNEFRPEPRDQARSALGWPAAEHVALFAANPSLPSKRFELAKRACEHASEIVGQVRLQVVHGVAPDEIPRLMNAADCLIHPSASEGSSNVIKEALACNLPVVATPVGDAVERLAGVVPSFVCQPEVDALGKSIAECVQPPRRSNGREHCAGCSEEYVTREIGDLYRNLLVSHDGGR